MLLRSTACLLVFSALGFACIDAPRFGDGELEQGGSATATNPYPGMVLVQGVTLDANGTITPLDREDDEEKGKGKGKGSGGGGNEGGGNEGGGNAGDPPPPAPGNPPPAAPVAVASFWIDALEVSAADYEACVAQGACDKAGEAAGCTAPAGLAAHPINCVTFDQAARYCAFKDKRLPSSVEWTVAAGGAARRTFPWGAEPPAAAYLNACGSECASHAMYTGSDGFAATAPRGSYASGATPDGIHDLAGNVAEWVSDGVVRGGSFEDVTPASVSVRAVTAVARNASKPAIGFRCARGL